MTFLDSAGDVVLKSDTVGRVRVPRERREQLLREFANRAVARFLLRPSLGSINIRACGYPISQSEYGGNSQVIQPGFRRAGGQGACLA